MKFLPHYARNLPVLLSSALAAVWVWQTHATQEATALFLGIIAGGLVDLDNRLTGRIRNILLTLLHFSAASLAVQLCMGHEISLALLLTVAAFCLTLAGALDIRYRTIAFGSLLVMMYTVLSYQPHMVWYLNPLMIVCGALLYSLCTLLLHIMLPHRPVQEALAAAYRRLGDYMLVKAQFFDPDEADYLHSKEVSLALKNSHVIHAFNACRSALFYRLRSQHRHPRTVRMLQYYLAAQNIHERISSRHVDYRDFARHLAHSDLIYRIQRLIVLQAHSCYALVDTILADNEFRCDDTLKRAGNGLQIALSRYLNTFPAQEHHALQQLVTNLLALSGQMLRLEHIRLATMEDGEDNRIAGQDIENLGEIGRILGGHLNRESAVFRHAVRMAVISAVGCLLVYLFRPHLGYWILLTALIVCQPNYSATTTRLKQRIIGTVAGVAVGSLLPYFTPSLFSQLFVVVLSGSLFFVFRTARYSYSTFFITLQVLAGFTLMGQDPHSALYARVVDTVLGAAIAWAAVSYVWPDWHYLPLGKTAIRVLQGNASYLKQVLQQLERGHADDVTYRIARRLAHERAVALGNSVSDMSIEAARYGSKLQDGFNLLQLNYALISSISAIGALRSQLYGPARDPAFLTAFCRVGQALADIMLHTDTREPQRFQAAHAWMEQALLALKPDEHGRVPASNHILWAQLQALHERLPAYFDALRRSLDQNDIPAAS